MNQKDQALEKITERIDSLRSAKDAEVLGIRELRLMGYLEALEDQGLLSDKEVEKINREVEKVCAERGAQIVSNGRQKP